MIKIDCRYHSHRLIPANPPLEPIDFAKISRCNLFNITIRECPPDCVHYHPWILKEGGKGQ